MDPDGNFLFYGSSTIGGVTEGVGSLAVNAGTGGLSVVPGSPFAVNNVPFMVASHPTGKFLYTADLGPLLGGFTLQSVSAFSVDAVTGALSPVNSPYPAPANSTVHGLVIHPSGNFVYAPAGPSVGILGWSVGQDGSLTSLPGSPFAPGIAAVNGTFDPTGKFFYLSGSLGGGILGYSVNSADGSLAPLAGSPFGVGSTFASPTLDPSGQFLFAGDFQNQAVAEFRVDGNSGALTSVGSTPTSGIPETLVVVQAP
jgi:6-phosphogluconolactonase (cycloisomerase 2 family)